MIWLNSFLHTLPQLGYLAFNYRFYIVNILRRDTKRAQRVQSCTAMPPGAEPPRRREQIKAVREPRITVLTLGCCSRRAVHPLCMIIKPFLRGYPLMGCSAEPRKAPKRASETGRALGAEMETATGGERRGPGRCSSLHLLRTHREKGMQRCLHRHYKDLTHHSPGSRQATPPPTTSTKSSVQC